MILQLNPNQGAGRLQSPFSSAHGEPVEPSTAGPSILRPAQDEREKWLRGDFAIVLNQGGQLLAHSIYNRFGLDNPAIYAARKAAGGRAKRQRFYPCLSNFN